MSTNSVSETYRSPIGIQAMEHIPDVPLQALDPTVDDKVAYRSRECLRILYPQDARKLSPSGLR